MYTLAVDGVLAVLVLMSIVSWTIWITKLISFKKIKSANELFDIKYATLQSTSQKYQSCTELPCEFAQLALVGLNTQAVHRKSSFDLLECRDTAEREMGQVCEIILTRFESGLSELGSISTLAPFVGLFGTVWGIMDAMNTIASSGHATIESVSGPVGESLISTAIGILVAIPASAFFNHLTRQIKLQSVRLHSFGEQVIQDMSAVDSPI
jgi:biopolymer transport protein ExbB